MKNSTRNWKLGVILPVLGLLGALLSAPRVARANSGNSFLEAVGVSTAVGTVLGASTLPFYDQPGTHLINLAYGASLGAVTGVGIWIYGLVGGGSSQDEAEQANSGQPSLRWFASGDSTLRVRRAGRVIAARMTNVFHPSWPALAWTPVVSLNW